MNILNKKSEKYSQKKYNYKRGYHKTMSTTNKNGKIFSQILLK